MRKLELLIESGIKLINLEYILKYKMVSKIEKNLEFYMSFIFLLIYTVVIIQDIFRRIVFSNSSTWGLEIVLGLFTWVVWVAASLAIRQRSHFRFTLTRSKMSNRVNYYLHYVDTFLWIIIASVILRFAIIDLNRRLITHRNIIGTPIPDYIPYISVPVGFALIMFRSAQKMYIIRKEYNSGQDVTPDSSIE